ncbi:MAG: hypothetical protein ACREBS_02560 [Nitrososphaerales archaeon]
MNRYIMIIDYVFWGFIIGIATLVLLAFSVLAQYLGLFAKPNFPLKEKVLIYLNGEGIVGGIVIRTSGDSVALRKTYYVKEVFALGSDKVQQYVTMQQIGETNIPMSSIRRWKKFPQVLSDQWNKLPEA